MSILQSIEEIIALHDKYASVRYDDKNYHVTLLIDMFNQWHSQSSKLFSRYLPSEDLDLVKFKDAEIGNAYVLSGVFNELETTFLILVDKLKNSPFCKLEDFIEEGELLVKTIKYQPPSSGVCRTFRAYTIPNEPIYLNWKNKCSRLLEIYFAKINALEEFKDAIAKFEKHYDPRYMHDMIGILKSLIEIPVETINESKNVQQVSTVPLTVNVVQNQTQNQSIAINIFLESIKDELNGRQIKELKEIVENESEPQKAKEKILDKLKSFGLDVLSNIVANLLTNPSVWSSFV